MAGTAQFNGEVSNIESNINKVDSFDKSLSEDAASQKYPSMQCLKEFLSVIYPIGSIYISAASTSPATLFGGTWEQIKGRFLLAAGENEANTTTDFGSMGAGELNRPAGELGGEPKHTDTVDEMPGHRHSYLADKTGGEGGALAGIKLSWGTAYSYTENAAIQISGGSQPHNNMPPYLTVYVWKRTA